MVWVVLCCHSVLEMNYADLHIYSHKIGPFSAKPEVKSPSLNVVSTAIQEIMLDKL